MKKKCTVTTRTKRNRNRFVSLMIYSVPLLVFSVVGCSSNDDDTASTPTPQLRAPLNTSDSLALVKIYQECGPWDKKWDLKDITTWNGVTVGYNLDTQELRVTGFEVYNGNFSGTFPKEFCQLTELRRLVVSGGILRGTIPEEIGELTNLYYLCIQNNQMTGRIPPSIGKLVNLRKLALGFNHLCDTLPASIGNLKDLEYLDIVQSELSGNIPKSFGKLMKLKMAWLNNNKLSGTFPLEAIQHNMYINCDYNNITELPFDIWKDDFPYLPPEIRFNRLKGDIPDWVLRTQKWKKNATRCITPQQENYGYNNYFQIQQ